MSDPIQGQISVIKPFLEELNGNSFFKKEKDLKEKLTKAINSLQQSDVSITIDLIIALLSVEKKNIRVQCIETLCNLFSARELEFFLAANTSTLILHKLIDILQEHKSPQYNEVIKCLSAFIKSQNQQLYLHNDDLQDFLSATLAQLDTNPNVENRKAVETVLTSFIEVLQNSLQSMDKIAISDYKVTVSTIVKFIGPSLQENSLSVLLNIIQKLVFEAPDSLKDTNKYKQIAMVDVPQLFIQIAFAAPDTFYDQILEMFQKFIAMGDFIIPSFPAIIAQLITPAFESKSQSIVKAVSYLEAISSLESHVLLTVFAMCDCSSTDSYRVFENLVNSITQCILLFSSNATVAISCLRCLDSILISFRNFFLTAGTKSDDEKSDNERFVLEKKMTMEGCAAIFNKSIKQGIQSLIQSELVEDDLYKIGVFLRSSPLLNPTNISEYIVKPENQKALEGFISTFNFQKVTLDQALRDLCSSFLLPGEAQQIDRVMICFSKKYHEDNPEIMTEDAAYAISFSIIMLQTDLHNENIKRKITCEEWIKNTREVEFAREVPLSDLNDIYERVKNKPLKMKTIFTTDGNQEQNQKKSRQLLRDLMERSNKEGLPSLSRELLILIIERLWPSLFACLSLLLSNYAIPEIVQVDLDCISQLIFFLSNFSMQKELESILSFLCNYCQISNGQCQTLAISKACSLAKECGEGFGNSWTYLLQLFSKIYTWGSNDLEAIDSSAKQNTKTTTEINHTQEIDSVFMNAKCLPGFAYVEFVKAMCNVATEELCMNPPVIFTLQKIIELMKESFDRVRFIWIQSWTLVRAQFNRTACLGHNEISMYAIDGLRQVVISCFNFKEMWSQFQIDILSPFLTIFMNNCLLEPRKLVLSIVEVVIPKIDTAWDVIIELLEAASCDSEISIIQSSFQIFSNNYLQIPTRHDLKVFLIMANYIIQQYVPSLNLESAKLLPKKSEETQEITSEYIEVLPSIIYTTDNKNVIEFVTDSYFMLLNKYIQKQDKIQTIAEHIMPIFAQTPLISVPFMYKSMSKYLISCSTNENDMIIPQTLIPWASSMFIQLMDFEIIHVFIEETAKVSILNEEMKEIATMSISLVLNNDSLQEQAKEYPKLLEDALVFVKENKLPKVSLLISKISSKLKLVQVESLSIEIVFSFLSEGALQDDEVADAVICALKMLNEMNQNKLTLKVVEKIVGESKSMNSRFFKQKKNEAIVACLEFLSNPSQEIRELVKSLALSLVDL